MVAVGGPVGWGPFPVVVIVATQELQWVFTATKHTGSENPGSAAGGHTKTRTGGPELRQRRL